MAVAHVATGTRSTGGTTQVNVAYPSGVAANRLALLSRVIKPSTATGTTPATFTSTSNQTGGTGAAGNDVGETRIVVDRLILTGSETGPVICTQANSPNSCHGVIQIYEISAGAGWDIVQATGSDATHGTGRSATATTTIPLKPGDVVVAICASDTDTTTAFTSPAITASGITLGATTQRLGAGGVGTGADTGLYIFDATVSTGTATVAPALSLTGGPSNCGPVAFVRLRQSTTVLNVPQAVEIETAEFPTAVKAGQVPQAVETETPMSVSTIITPVHLDVDWRTGDDARVVKKIWSADGTHASAFNIEERPEGNILNVELTAGTDVPGSNLRELLLVTETPGWIDGHIETTFGPRSIYGSTPDGDIAVQHGVAFRYQEAAGVRRAIVVWQNTIFFVNNSLLCGVWTANTDGTGFLNRQYGINMPSLARVVNVVSSSRTGNVATIVVDTADVFQQGNPVLVTVADSTYNGRFLSSSVNGTTITYPNTGADDASGGTGTASKIFPYDVGARVSGNYVDVRAKPTESDTWPAWSSVDPSAGIDFPGAVGDYVWTDDAAALDIVGDITIACDFSPTTFPPSSQQSLVSKYQTTTNNRSYRLILTTAGRPQFAWSPLGTGTIGTLTADATPTLTNGRVAFKIQFDADNGAAGRTAKFYTAPTMDGPWTQLGTDQTSGGATSIFSGNAVLELGAVNAGALERFTGRIHGFAVRSGKEDTWVAPVADIDGGVLVHGDSTFTDRSSRAWTAAGATAVVNAGNATATAFSTDINKVGSEANRIATPAPVGPGSTLGSVGVIPAHLGISDLSHATFGPIFATNATLNFFTDILDQATETETAQAITAVEIKPVPQATETESAQAITARKTVSLAQAVETEVAQAVTAVRTVAVAQVVETETAQTVTPVEGGQVIAAPQAVETESAQSVSVHKTAAVPQATETETAQAVVGHKTAAVPQATETEQAGTVTAVSIYPVPAATETESAQAIAKRKTAAVPQVVETELAQTISLLGVIAQAVELETAGTVSPVKRAVLAQALETEFATLLEAFKIVVLSQALETELAQTVTAAGGGVVGPGRAMAVTVSESGYSPSFTDATPIIYRET